MATTVAPKSNTKYGCVWPADADPLEIEFACIRRNGEWMQGDQKCGAGLFNHFMEARKLLWPKRWRHKWVDLIYKEILANMVTILMGSFSCGKTSIAAEYVVIDYLAHSENTMVLLSTTSVDKLKSAVFGEVQMLWSDAKKRYPWLPGNLLDHKNAITTDRLSNDQDLAEGEISVRDMRKGIVGKACFPTGTLVDTPSGKTSIEALKIGDLVLNAIGVSVVRETMTRSADRLVRITLDDNTTIDCTPEHPILTNLGWLNAIDVGRAAELVSTHESMRLLQEASPVFQRKTKKILQRCLPRECLEKDLQMVRQAIRPERSESENRFLYHVLFREVDNESASACISDASIQKCSFDGGEIEKVIALKSEGIATAKRPDGFSERNAFIEPRKDNGRSDTLRCISRSAAQFQSADSINDEAGHADLFLQDRFGVARASAGGGSGRRVASPEGANRQRFQEGNVPARKRVVSVEILECSSDSRFAESEGGYRVHNLEIEGHPSYSVNGCLVHNCFEGSRYVGLGVYSGIKQDRIRFLADELQFMAPTFFDCLPNMIGSVMTDENNQPEIKIIGSGNPKHDPFDQLGVAAEPEGGWASIGLVEKTTVWPTKFERGKCVNLIGLDSPNLDVPEDVRIPYPKLINRSTIRAVEKRWDRNSLKFNEQCVGRMMIGFTGNRVITMDLCRNTKAMERAVWKGTRRTKIGFVDPSWTSAGDRCIWGWLEFGENSDGEQIIRFAETRIIPLVGGTRDEPDMQIANFVKAQAEALGILPDNIFYGSTGRGTTGAAFARVFGYSVPVPIAEGGIPSPRPVRHDLFVDDERGEKRHKRCDEEYSKFITELWFAVRNVIECGQMRELPEEVINEGCAREYTTVKGYKIEVESKEEMKETLGYSPDLFDALTFGVEGARQRGFQIKRLGSEIVVESNDDPDWLEREAKEYQEALRGGLLQQV